MSTMNYGYQLRRVSGPDIEPVTLDEVRTQLKLDADLTAENALLQNIYIPGAREAVEDYTGLTLCDSTWLLSLDDFPRHWTGEGRITLPRGPVVAVLGVSYLANDGTRTPLAADGWIDGLDDTPSWIAPPYGEFWPNGRVTGGAVQIEYRAGYPGAGSPPDASRVPVRAKQTILTICTRWFENRQQSNVDDLLEAGVFQLRVFP